MGHTSDFFPNKPLFHLFPIDEPQDKAIAVQIKDLRAIFFVRDFARDPVYSERKEFAEGARPPGRVHPGIRPAAPRLFHYSGRS